MRPENISQEEILTIIKQGAEAWAAWLEEHGLLLKDTEELDEAEWSSLNWLDTIRKRQDLTVLNNIDLTGFKLVGFDFAHFSLYGINLSYADLTNANLTKANLTKANLEDACLTKANLAGAELRRVNLSGISENGHGIVLNGATLSRAYINWLCIDEIDLGRATVSEVNLSRAFLPNAIISWSRLSKVDLSNAHLKGASLWRTKLSQVSLSGADLSKANLTRADFREVNLAKADLSKANLSKANLSEVNLIGANLSEANLSGANLSGANLTKTILNGVDLSGASLRKGTFISTKIEGTVFDNCRIYGISAWDLVGQPASQKDLIITDQSEPHKNPIITVDDIEVAQFIYLMLNNSKIRKVLTTMTGKGVLILGRFETERKKVLDAIRDELRKLDYLPIMFDFDKLDSRNYTETVRILAGLSKFVIADLTGPKSIPLELQAIVPIFKIPVVPIIHASEESFSMASDLRMYPWVLDEVTYEDQERLLQNFQDQIITPALDRAQQLLDSGKK